MTSNILALSDVPVDRRFVIYGEWAKDVLYFSDSIDDATLKEIPRSSVDLIIREDKGLSVSDDCTIDFWTRPFKQDDYINLLTVYSRVLCGKDVIIFEGTGWTKHTITI